MNQNGVKGKFVRDQQEFAQQWGDALRKDPNQVLVVGVANVLDQVLEFAGKLGLQDVTVEVRLGSVRYGGITSLSYSNLRFSRFGNAKDVGHAEILQDFALRAGLEWSDVESCSTQSLDQQLLLSHSPDRRRLVRRTWQDLLRLPAHLVLPVCAVRHLILECLQLPARSMQRRHRARCRPTRNRFDKRRVGRGGCPRERGGRRAAEEREAVRRTILKESSR
jgi:hypothetical protein